MYPAPDDCDLFMVDLGQRGVQMRGGDRSHLEALPETITPAQLPPARTREEYWARVDKMNSAPVRLFVDHVFIRFAEETTVIQGLLRNIVSVATAQGYTTERIGDITLFAGEDERGINKITIHHHFSPPF